MEMCLSIGRESSLIIIVSQIDEISAERESALRNLIFKILVNSPIKNNL